tara:strand:- start:10289 stop:10528 length:240 start_codon:yes stop_codon:yes gene_type:complete
MSEKKTDLQIVRDIIGNLIEEAGADAAVVVYSKVLKGKTETHLIPYGNAHTCNALIDYAYENFGPPTPEDIELEEDIDE